MRSDTMSSLIILIRSMLLAVMPGSSWKHRLKENIRMFLFKIVGWSSVCGDGAKAWQHLIVTGLSDFSVSDIHAMAKVPFPWQISKQDTHVYLVITYKVLILEQKISGFLGQCTVYQYILGFRVSSENFLCSHIGFWVGEVQGEASIGVPGVFLVSTYTTCCCIDKAIGAYIEGEAS